MEKEIASALIGAGAGLVGTVLGYLGGRQTNKMQKELAAENVKQQRRAFLDGVMLKMLEYQMQFPHFEDSEFCHKFPTVPGEQEMKLKYEAYCIFVFNFLSMAFRHFEQKSEELGNYIGLGEILLNHHKWWQHDLENLGYDKPFRECIQTVIDELRKERKIP